MKMTYKGRYSVKNPDKYIGNPTNVIYRSSWERKMMKWCDLNPDVLQWGSEEHIIPYKSPIDNRVHRYYVDFFVKVKNKTGGVDTYLVEVKPKKFTKPPKSNPTRKTRSWLNEVKQWGVNSAKWKAAEEFCADRKWKFIILTEDHLN
jgi:hypothetical protein